MSTDKTRKSSPLFLHWGLILSGGVACFTIDTINNLIH